MPSYPGQTAVNPRDLTGQIHARNLSRNEDRTKVIKIALSEITPSRSDGEIIRACRKLIAELES